MAEETKGQNAPAGNGTLKTIPSERLPVSVEYTPPPPTPTKPAGVSGVGADRSRRIMALYAFMKDNGLEHEKAIDLIDRVNKGKVKENEIEPLLKGMLTEQAGKQAHAAAGEDIRQNVIPHIDRQTALRLETPNRTVKWQRPVRQRGHTTYEEVTSRNYDPNTYDLTEGGAMYPAIPGDAKIVSDESEQLPTIGNRARLAIDRQKAENIINMSQLAPSYRGPRQFRLTTVGEDEQKAKSAQKGIDLARRLRDDIASAGMPLAQGSLYNLYSKTIGTPDNPITAIYDPRTPRDFAWSALANGALVLATGGAGAGVSAAAASLSSKAPRIGAAIKALMTASNTGAVLSKAPLATRLGAGAKAIVNTMNRWGLAAVAEDIVTGRIPMTVEQSKEWFRKNNPDVHLPAVTDEALQKTANALRNLKADQTLTETIDETIGFGNRHLTQLFRGLHNAPYFVSARMSPFENIDDLADLRENAGEVIKASTVGGQSTFAQDMDAQIREMQAHKAKWAPDMDKSFTEYLAYGLGNMVGILSPFRTMVAAAGFKPLSTTKMLKALVRDGAADLLLMGAKTNVPRAFKEGGKWLGGMGANLLYSFYAGSFALPGIYSEGRYTFNEMMDGGKYTPGQAAVTGFLIPYITHSTEFFSESNLLPEMAHNFGRGILSRMGKRALLMMNPWEAAEEVLQRNLTYAAETIGNVPNEYREQPDVPFPFSMKSRALQEAVGDLIMTTGASIITGLGRGQMFDRQRSRVARMNISDEKAGRWTVTSPNDLSLQEAHERGLVITALQMEDALVNGSPSALGQSPFKGKRDAVHTLSNQDLSIEFFSYMHGLKGEEREIFEKVVRHNVYGITAMDAARMLSAKENPQDIFSQSLGFKDPTEMAAYMQQVNEEYEDRKIPWLLTTPEFEANVLRPTPEQLPSDEDTAVPLADDETPVAPTSPAAAPLTGTPTTSQTGVEATLDTPETPEAAEGSVEPDSRAGEEGQILSRGASQTNTLTALKNVAAAAGIEVTGDKRYKKAYVDAINAHIAAVMPTPPEVAAAFDEAETPESGQIMYQIDESDNIQPDSTPENQAQISSIISELQTRYPDITLSSEESITTPEGQPARGYADFDAMKVGIDFARATADTPPHEYAHFYVRMFRSNEIVRRGIQQAGSEENLVQQIGEAYVSRMENSPLKNWLSDFWGMVKNFFGKEDVQQTILRGFSRAQQLGTTRPISGKAFQTNAPDLSVSDKLIESPIEGTRPVGERLVSSMIARGYDADGQEMQFETTVSEVRTGNLTMQDAVSRLAATFGPGSEADIYSLLHAERQRITVSVLSPDLNGNVGTESRSMYAPVAMTAGALEKMLASFGFTPVTAADGTQEPILAYIDNNTVESLASDLSEGGGKTDFGALASDHPKEFTAMIENLASRGYFYLGPAGRNETFLFLHVDPSSLAKSGAAHRALENTLAGIGRGEGSEMLQRMATGQYTPFDLIAHAQAAFGTWMKGLDWAQNIDRFYKYANTYASSEPYGDDELARHYITNPDSYEKMMNEAGRPISPGFLQIWKKNEETGEWILNEVQPNVSPETLAGGAKPDWNFAARLKKAGYTLTHSGLMFKRGKDGAFTDVRILTIPTHHPFWVDDDGEFHLYEEKVAREKKGEKLGWKEVGDGAGVQSPGSSWYISVSHGDFYGTDKIEKSRTMKSAGEEKDAREGLLFKGQYEVAEENFRRLMEEHGIGRLMFTSTMKQGKNEWQPVTLRQIETNNVPSSSMIRLSPASVTRAGSGQLRHSDRGASLAGQAILANMFNTMAFPKAAEAIARVSDFFASRSRTAREMLAALSDDDEVRAILTLRALDGQGESALPRSALAAVRRISQNFPFLTQLPQFVALSRALAHNTVMRSLFDPSSSSFRTIGAGMFLKADWGTLDMANIKAALPGNISSDNLRETLTKYFDIQDVVTAGDYAIARAEVTEAPAEGKAKPRPNAEERAIEKELGLLFKEMAEEEGEENVTAIEARARSSASEWKRVTTEAIDRYLKSQGYRPLVHKRGTYYLKGTGLMKEWVEENGRRFVPVVASRASAEHAGWRTGENILLTAIPTDAPHSVTPARIIGMSDSADIVSWSPNRTRRLGKDHDGDELHAFGESEGYWFGRLNEPGLDADTKSLYRFYAHHGYMEMDRATFVNLYDHFASPDVQNMIGDLYAKIGIKTAFDKMASGKSKGAAWLLSNGFVKPTPTTTPPFLSPEWHAYLTGRYVGSTGGAIGHVASTRMRIDYLIQNLEKKLRSDGSPMIANRTSGGMTAIEKIAVANALLTHHAVDAPKETDFFEYTYNSNEHVSAAIALLAPRPIFNLKKDDPELYEATRQLLHDFSILRSAQSGTSRMPKTRGRALSLPERLGLLQYMSKKGNVGIYDQIAAGMSNPESLSRMTADEYREHAYKVEDILSRRLLGSDGFFSVRFLNRGANRARMSVHPEDRNTTLGYLKYAFQQRDHADHEPAVITGDALGRISFYRWLNDFAKEGRVAGSSLADLTRRFEQLQSSRVMDMIPEIFSYWVQNINEKLFTSLGPNTASVVPTKGGDFTLSREGVRTPSGTLLTPDVAMRATPADGLKFLSALFAISDTLGGVQIVSPSQMNKAVARTVEELDAALTPHPTADFFKTAARLVMMSEIPLGFVPIGSGSGIQLRLWDGMTPTGQSLKGGILARSSELLADVEDTAPKLAVGSKAEGGFTAYAGWQYATPEIIEALAEAVRDVPEIADIRHEAETPSRPVDASSEDMAQGEDIARSAADEIERLEGLMNGMKEGDPIRGKLEAHIASLRGIAKSILIAVGIGGVISTVLNGADAAALSDMAQAGMTLSAATVVVTPAVKAWAKRAISQLTNIMRRIRNRIPGMFAILVNRRPYGGRTEATYTSMNPYDQVGFHSGRLAIYDPKHPRKEGKGGFHFIAQAKTLAQTLLLGSDPVVGAMGQKSVNLINDVFTGLTHSLGETIAIAKGQAERILLQADGLMTDPETGENPLSSVNFLDKPLSNDSDRYENDKLAHQLLSEELHTGSVFDLRLIYDPKEGKWVWNKEVQASSAEFKKAVERYGNADRARAILNAVQGIKEAYVPTYVGLLDELQTIFANAAAKIKDKSKSASLSARVDNIIEQRLSLQNGEHAFPVAFAEYISSKPQAAAANFVELYTDTYARKDDLLGVITDPSDGLIDAVHLEALALFVNQGGKMLSEKEIIGRIAGTMGSKVSGEASDLYKAITGAISAKINVNEYARKIANIEKVRAEQLANPAISRAQAAAINREADMRIAKYEDMRIKEMARLGDMRSEMVRNRGLSAALTRAKQEVRGAGFDRKAAIAPSRARLSMMLPTEAKEFVDMEALADEKTKHLSRLSFPLHTYFSQDVTGTAIEGIHQMLGEVYRQHTLLYRDWVTEQIRSNAGVTDPEVEKAITAMDKWIAGNFGYRIWSTPVRMDRLMKGENVAIDVEFVIDQKSGEKARRTLYATADGKDPKTGRYRFFYHTPAGQAQLTYDPATDGVSGVGREHLGMSVDISVLESPFVFNPTARLKGLRLAVEDEVSGIFGTRGARFLENMKPGLGMQYLEKYIPMARFISSVLNTALGVTFLAINPFSAVRNFFYPYKHLAITGGGALRPLTAAKRLGELLRESSDPETARALNEILDALPFKMFDYLARGLGEGGEQSFSVLKDRYKKSLQLLKEYNQIIARAEAYVDKEIEKGGVADPAQRAMMIREEAVHRFTKAVARPGSAFSALVDPTMMKPLGKKAIDAMLNAGYFMFAKVEKFNREMSMAIALLNTHRMFTKPVGLGLVIEGETINPPFSRLAQDAKREIIQQYALNIRREDERINYDYSQIMRPAYLRKATGQMFFKFATFTQASWIWRMRDIKAGMRDYKLLKSGRMTLDGKTLTVTDALRDVLKINKAVTADMKYVINPSMFTPDKWRSLTEYVIERIGDVEVTPEDTPDVVAKKNTRRKAIEAEIVRQLKENTAVEGGHEITLAGGRYNELTRGVRMAAMSLIEAAAALTMYQSIGVFKEPLTDFMVTLLEMLGRVTNIIGPDDDDLLIEYKGYTYDLRDNVTYQQYKRDEWRALAHNLSFVIPFGGILASQVFREIGEMIIDPLGVDLGSTSPTARLWDVLAKFRGIENLTNIVRNFASSESDYGTMSKFNRMVHGSTELFEVDYAEKKLDEFPGKVKKEIATKGDKANLEQYDIKRVARTAMTYYRITREKTFSDRERKWESDNIERLEKAYRDFEAQQGRGGTRYKDGIKNLIDFYYTMALELAIKTDDDAVERAKFFYPEEYHNIEGAYEGRTIPELKNSEVGAKAKELARQMARDAFSEWAQLRPKLKLDIQTK